MKPTTVTVSFRISTEQYRKGEVLASAAGKTIGEMSRGLFLKSLVTSDSPATETGSVADDPKVKALLRRAVWAVVVALGPWDEKQTEAFVDEFLP